MSRSQKIKWPISFLREVTLFNQNVRQSYVSNISSCLSPKYRFVMATELWLNNSMSLTNASSEFSLFIL